MHISPYLLPLASPSHPPYPTPLGQTCIFNKHACASYKGPDDTVQVGEKEWEWELLLHQGGSICCPFVKPWLSSTSHCQPPCPLPNGSSAATSVGPGSAHCPSCYAWHLVSCPHPLVFSTVEMPSSCEENFDLAQAHQG